MAADATARAVKHSLRQAALQRRGARSAADITAAGAALAARASALTGYRSIAAFLSTPTEPPTRPLLDALVAAGGTVIVPVVTGEWMDWTPYDVDAPVTTSPLGIDEPSGELLGPRALLAADVILIPALAVDHAGNRLGRGRGYYDRALTGVTAPVIAVVFDDELTDVVPVEAHDRRVSAVLRPSGWLEF